MLLSCRSPVLAEVCRVSIVYMRDEGRWQLAKRRFSSFVMGNVRSLETQGVGFLKPQLRDNIPDSTVSLASFQCVWADSSCRKSNKKAGGGVVKYVNNKWCNPQHMTVKERVCSPDIELLAVWSWSIFFAQ